MPVFTELAAVQNDGFKMKGSCTMTAKQYLQQTFRLNAKIDAKKIRIEQLRAFAESVSPPELSHDKVQAGRASDQMGENVTKIVDLEKEKNAEIQQLLDLQEEIESRLKEMPDDDLCLILEKRYINLQKWEQIALDLNYTYRHTTRLHGEAIQAFQEKFNDVLECPIESVV